MMRGLKPPGHVVGQEVHVLVAGSAPIMRGLKHARVGEGVARDVNGVAGSAPIMRGLKLDGPDLVPAEVVRRRARPDEEGIETGPIDPRGRANHAVSQGTCWRIPS